jgi:hypothetical protein
MTTARTDADLAAGLALAGLRTTARLGRSAMVPARAATRLPVVGSRLERFMTRTAASLEAEGRILRIQLRAQLEAVIAAVLASPEMERTLDRALAGRLTEVIARSVATHRVAERLAGELAATGELERAFTSALEHETTQRVLERALAGPAVERMMITVLESRLVPELTDHLLRSRELQVVLDHIARSPELRRALTDQGSSMAGEMADGLRDRTESLDDAAERTLRGWLRRPRPAGG